MPSGCGHALYRAILAAVVLQEKEGAVLETQDENIQAKLPATTATTAATRNETAMAVAGVAVTLQEPEER